LDRTVLCQPVTMQILAASARAYLPTRFTGFELNLKTEMPGAGIIPSQT